MVSQRQSKKSQQDFFTNMQIAFLGDGGADSSGGIVGQLKAAADDLRAASDMMKQNSQAKPTYGGPNGGRPTFSGDGTKRPHSAQGDTANPANGYTALRTMVAQQVGQRFGSTGPIYSKGNSYSPIYDRNGNVTHYEEYDASGSRTGTKHEASSASGQQAAGVFKRQQAIQGTTAAIGSGTIFTQGANGEVHTPGVSVAQKIAHSIPLVGGLAAAAIGIPDLIFNQVVKQRAQNAQFQAILGGTNSGTGFHNRRLMEGFKLSQLYSGGMTGAMSEEAFKGVTNLGYTGAFRNNALDTISSNYKNFGMGPGESLDFISTMAKTSSTNFEQLKQVLTDVSKAAKDTGQNLEQARKNLSNLFNAAVSANGGPGALATAGAIAQFQTSQGRNFANVDFSNMLPGRNIAITGMMANTLGQNIGTYELQQAGGGPLAQQQFGQAANQQMAMSVSTAVADPNVVQTINNLAQKYGGKDKIAKDNNSVQDFVQFCLKDSQFDQVVGPYVMTIQASSAAYTGAQMQAEQIAEMIIRQVLGVNASFTQGKQQQAAQKASMQQQTKKVDNSRGAVLKRGIEHTNPQDIPATTGKGANITIDPLLDKFKSQFDSSDVHVKVKTAKGDMVVSGKYAIDHLQDQLAKGTAVFMDGDYAGQSVADALGGGYGESNYKGKDTTGVKPNKHFETTSKFNSKGGGGGTVTINPNPALAQLLSFSATGNINIANQAAMKGLPPVPGQTGINTGG